MKQRPQIFLADLLRAVEALQPGDAETVHAMSKMLSLDYMTPGPESKMGGAWSRQYIRSFARTLNTALRGAANALDDKPPEDPDPAVDEPGAPLDARIEKVSGSATEITIPGWATQVTALEPSRARPSAPQAPDPLFNPPRQRAIVGALLTTWNEDGAPDIDRLIDRLVAQQPITSIPRHTEPTLRRGVQVLVDVSMSMAPYRHDQQDLLRRIDTLLSRSRTQTLYFAGDPRRAGPGPRDGWEPWQPPTPGTPILLLSDLGIGGPPLDRDRVGLETWFDFSEQAREHRCPLTALVPYGPRRWPRALAKAMTLIHWDRGTTVSAVRHALGPEH